MKQFFPFSVPAALALGISFLASAPLTAHESDKSMDGMMGGAMAGHHASGPATITLSLAAPSTPFAAGVETAALIRLKDSQGKPVTFEQLQMAHTKKIHLLIVDASLTDYHHEHPVPTGNAGEYSFTFKPANGGRYTLFADLLPLATGKQEYAKTEVDVAGNSRPQDQSASRIAMVDGYRFELTTEGDAPFREGEATLVNVTVTKPDGKPADNLEPIMGAFAHGVGFPADLSGVTHVHPMGKEPENPSERGGPNLSFHLIPERAGYMKFYVQVQIDGRDRFAGFGLKVEPSAANASTDPAASKPALDAAQMEFLKEYEAVHDSLAADDLEGTRKAAQILAQLKEPAAKGTDEIAKSATLEAAREAFKKLSAQAAGIAANQPGFYVIACPMVKAGVWVQNSDQVSNPYLGTKMPGCGVVEH